MAAREGVAPRWRRKLLQRGAGSGSCHPSTPDCDLPGLHGPTRRSTRSKRNTVGRLAVPRSARELWPDGEFALCTRRSTATPGAKARRFPTRASNPLGVGVGTSGSTPAPTCSPTSTEPGWITPTSSSMGRRRSEGAGRGRVPRAIERACDRGARGGDRRGGRLGPLDPRGEHRPEDGVLRPPEGRPTGRQPGAVPAIPSGARDPPCRQSAEEPTNPRHARAAVVRIRPPSGAVRHAEGVHRVAQRPDPRRAVARDVREPGGGVPAEATPRGPPGTPPTSGRRELGNGTPDGDPPPNPHRSSTGTSTCTQQLRTWGRSPKCPKTGVGLGRMPP